ncbi:MAG: PAS domain-containing protein, partial [Alphaproteobacteria bacterium]
MASKVDQKKKPERVSLLDDHYRVLVNHTSDLIFLRDKNGILLYVTPSVEKTIGYKPEELIGKTTWWLIHPDDRPQIEDWKKRVLEQKEDYHSLARMKNRTGEYVWLDTVTKVIRDQDGEFKYIISTSRDVTHQKTAEADKERLQTLIEEAFHELSLIDPKTMKFSFGNTKALENLGYSLAEFTKLGPHDVAGDQNKKFFKGLFAPVLSGEKKKIVFEGLNRRKDGSTYEVEVTLQTTASEGKQMVAALIEDISEKKRVRAEIEAINRRYRMFTEMTNDIIVQRDASGKVHYVSPAVKKHLGY